MCRLVRGHDPLILPQFPAALIQREVLDKQRRALVVYGVMHLQRQNLLSNYELVDDPRVQTVVQQLEIAGAPRVFTVWMNTRVELQTLQPDVASWPMPSLALIPGTTLGVADFEFYYPSETPRATLQDGRVVPIPREQWRSLAMEDQFDAVLYLGPPSAMTTSRVSPTLCQDAAYIVYGDASRASDPPAAPG